MLEPRGGFDLAPEALETEAELRREHFESNGTTVAEACAKYTVAMPPWATSRSIT